MTNGEKYKTAKERAVAFHLFCKSHSGGECKGCPLKEPTLYGCEFHWLDLEAPSEEPLPCPFCGKQTAVAKYGRKNDFEYRVICDCSYMSPVYNSPDDAIHNHNRVAKSLENEKVLQTHYLLGDLTAVCHILCPNNNGYEDKCELCYCNKLLSELCDLERRIKRYRETMENSAAKEKEDDDVGQSTRTVSGATYVKGDVK